MPVVPAILADAERILRDGPWPLEAWPNGPSDPGGVVSSGFVEQVVLSAAPFGQRRLLDVAFTFGCLQHPALLLAMRQRGAFSHQSCSRLPFHIYAGAADKTRPHDTTTDPPV